jgi:hypothetical protein
MLNYYIIMIRLKYTTDLERNASSDQLKIIFLTIKTVSNSAPLFLDKQINKAICQVLKI